MATQPADHVPIGNPCARCKRDAFIHRVHHKPMGNPCKVCGLPERNHRVRDHSERDAKRARDITYIGIDGEGQGRQHHKYVFLAASDESGERTWYVENEDGLTTEQCLDFLVNLPTRRTKAFCYAFNYDLTKILTDVDDKTLYLLFRPELRARGGEKAVMGPKPVRWGHYTLNLQGTKFTVRRGDRKRVLWDIWKFYQGRFVDAIKEWKVGDKETVDFIAYMKDHRSEFDQLPHEKVREYCFLECKYMAALAHKLVDAHEKVGLKLQGFYGAGSSASAMLKVMGIREQIVQAPPEMREAVASAFFGGRFENSAIGTIEGAVYNYDISSAYPYQLYFLPCLVHLRWEHTTRRKNIETARTALVHYRLKANASVIRKFGSWGPFPYRIGSWSAKQKGSICFPIESGGGWVWRDEYLAGESLYPHVQFVEAWIAHSDCECRPFARIPEFYRERVRIGKEGPGIVLKLGTNSCYGKLAQSVGNALFNSWVWAGLITSGTRAQILKVFAYHRDWSNLLMIATDGVFTRERLATGEEGANAVYSGDMIPKDTGTWETKKPLGGWEEKVAKQGIFMARPGVYFPLNPTKEDLKSVRARGVGKAIVLENWAKIVEGWNRHGIKESVKIAQVSRFCGAKSSLHRTKGPDGKFIYKRAFGEGSTPQHQMPSYGEWVTRPVEMSFDPMPKREGINKDGVTLALRRMPLDEMSMPYRKALVSKEAADMLRAALELEEQPDGDLSDYSTEG
jgi:hypothetical protein